MSFSSEIKEKLCKTERVCGSCAVYETAGALLFGGTVKENEIRFSTENKAVAERVREDISLSFGIDLDIIYGTRAYRIETTDVHQCENICGGILLDGGIPFSCCRASFARGAFLGGGSVTDPHKAYHMEFDTRSAQGAKHLKNILARDNFNARITDRKGRRILYIKGSGEIADILGYIGAPQGAFEMFNIQAEKEMRNDINRRVNCENANTDKSARASSKLLLAIRKIKKAGVWDKLPDVLREMGNLREEFPEDSLKELGAKADPPIGKSGVNHRLNRILTIAETL